jgi:hypothetical protein
MLIQGITVAQQLPALPDRQFPEDIP